MENNFKMTFKEDILRLKQARIDALQKELHLLQMEIDNLKANAEINNEFLTDIYYEDR